MNSIYQTQSSYSNNTIYQYRIKFCNIITFIFSISINHLSSNEIDEIKMNREKSYSIIRSNLNEWGAINLLLTNIDLKSSLNNWIDYENLISTCENNFNYQVLLKDVFNLYIKIDQFEFLTIANNIYKLIIGKFFLLNINLPLNFLENTKYYEYIDLLYNEFKEFLDSNDDQIKFSKLSSLLLNLLKITLNVITHTRFPNKSHIDLKNLFVILNILNVDSKKTILFDLLKGKIQNIPKESLYYIIYELLGAYNFFPKECINTSQCIKIGNDSKFLSTDLLEVIIDYCDYFNFPFDAKLSYYISSDSTKREEFLNKNPKLILTLMNSLDESNFKDKFNFLKSIYFKNKSKEDICNEDFYFNFIKFLLNSKPNIDESYELFDYFLNFYPVRVLEDYFSNQSNCQFIQYYFLNLNQSNLFTLIKILIYENGYKKISQDNLIKIFSLFSKVENQNYFSNIVSTFILKLFSDFHCHALTMIPQEILMQDFVSKIISNLKLVFNLDALYFENVFFQQKKDIFLSPDLFNKLPIKIKSHIISFLEIKDVHSLALTSKNNFQDIKESIYNDKNNLILKKILFFLFPKNEWLGNENIHHAFSLDQNIIINRSKIRPDIVFFIDEILKKTEREVKWPLLDQIKFLRIIENYFIDIWEKNIFWKKLSYNEIINFSDVNYSLNLMFYQMFDLYLMLSTINYRKTAFFQFLFEIDFELTKNNIDIFLTHFYGEFLNAITTYSDQNKIIFLLKHNSFFNMSLIHRSIELGLFYVDSTIEFYVLSLYLNSIKFSENIHLAIDFLNKRLSKKMLELILNQNFPLVFEFRLNYIKTIINSVNGCKNYLSLIISFLSINNDFWIVKYKDFLFEINSRQFYELCAKKNDGITISYFPFNDQKALINSYAKEYGFTKVLNGMIKNSNVMFSFYTLFNFAIHTNTDFKYFFYVFNNMYKKEKFHMKYDCVKELFTLYCDNIKVSTHNYTLNFDLLAKLANINEFQSLELFKKALTTLKLNSLSKFQKTILFQNVKGEDYSIFLLIKSFLKDEHQLKYLKKYFEIVKELIGNVNAQKLLQ